MVLGYHTLYGRMAFNAVECDDRTVTLEAFLSMP